MNPLCRGVLILLFLVCGCAKRDSSPPVTTVPSDAKHEHHPPHGGTAVVLGEDAYHLELVRDGGKFIAYVLDGEMENFVRVKAASFEVTAKTGGQPTALTFHAVGSQATGETIGDTSQFEAGADGLAGAASFDATLIALEIRGTKFEHIAFNFPRGNER